MTARGSSLKSVMMTHFFPDDWICLKNLSEDMDSIFILGPGGTLESIGERLGIDKTHLGIDIIKGKELLGKDLDERGIIDILDQQKIPEKGRAYIVVSPIGGQGFFLGRGNLQLSPKVIRKVGMGNLIVVSVPQKLDRTDALRVDTGDHELDMEFRAQGSMKVLTGYRTYRIKKIF